MTGAVAPYRWPTSEQEALLRAAFLSGAEALLSWQELTEITAVEDFEGASHCLLPLVYRNLREHGVSDAGIQKLKGTYRYNWYKNASLLEDFAELLRAFRDDGIEVMVRHDVALALRYYAKPGLRTMDGLHLLVRPGAAASAMELLERCGWNPLVQSPQFLLRSGTSCTFAHASGRRMLLSWHMLRPDVDDDTVWAASEELTLGEEPTRVVGATDALLDSCGLGSEWDAGSPARRVADAAIVLSSAGDRVDWDRLAFRGHQSAMVLTVRETLNYLLRVLQAPVPATVLDTMAAIAPSTLDRLEYEATPGAMAPINACRIYWHRYRQLGSDAGGGSGLFGFPRYLQQVWGYEEGWRAAAHAGHAVVRGVQREVSNLRVRGT
jgi:Uncharacterised nucleotidyltransferase